MVVAVAVAIVAVAVVPVSFAHAITCSRFFVAFRDSFIEFIAVVAVVFVIIIAVVVVGVVAFGVVVVGVVGVVFFSSGIPSEKQHLERFPKTCLKRFFRSIQTS